MIIDVDTNPEEQEQPLEPKINNKAQPKKPVQSGATSGQSMIKKLPQNNLYNDIGTKNGYIGIYQKDKKGNVYFHPVAKEIKIDAIKKNIETLEVSYKLSFEYLGDTITADLLRNELAKTKITKLAAYGADVFDHNSTQIIQHLRNEEGNAPTMNVHRRLGWDTVEGQEIFKYSEAIGLKSTYEGDLDITIEGSLESWKEMVRNEVIGNVPLETALIFGLSSVLVGYIGAEISLDCLVVHIFGNSTQGKTTACQLAISTAGYPDSKRNGLMTTWNGTSNAIIGILRGNAGLPVLLDESSVSNIKDFSVMVYTLATGREKARMDKEAQLQDVGTWRTTIISNGEHSLSSRTNQNIGIQMRISEFGNVTWTRDARNAEAIKEEVLKNHGHVAPLIAKKLISLGKEKVIEKWRECKADCLSRMKSEDTFAARLSSRLAVFALTAEIAEDVLGLGLNVESIKQFIINNERNDDRRDLFKTAYEYLIEKVTEAKNHFTVFYKGVTESGDVAKQELWGYIEHLRQEGKNKPKQGRITILTNVFMQIMLEGGFSDPKIILQKWKEMGLLDCEKDRLTRKRKFGSTGTRMNLYVIKFTPDDEPDESPDNDIDNNADTSQNNSEPIPESQQTDLVKTDEECNNEPAASEPAPRSHKRSKPKHRPEPIKRENQTGKLFQGDEKDELS